MRDLFLSGIKRGEIVPLINTNIVLREVGRIESIVLVAKNGTFNKFLLDYHHSSSFEMLQDYLVFVGKKPISVKYHLCVMLLNS